MPELPEVEVVRRGLEPLLIGRRIQSVHSAVPALRYPLPNLQVLVDLSCQRITRRAKYLLFEFEHDLLLVWHLGMTGQFHVLSCDVPKARHEHVRIDFDDGSSLRYRDARRFGYAGLMSTKSWQQHDWFRNLGPEPLSNAFDGKYLYEYCRNRKAPIKHVLMDAKAVVGVGNIYASEALFRAGIHPARSAGRISQERLHVLVQFVKEILREAIDAGGSTISDFVQVDGNPGYFAFGFQVYGRMGEACPRCDDVIRRIVQAGRSTFYCPGCQH